MTASRSSSLHETDYWIGLIPLPTWPDGSLLPPELLPVRNNRDTSCFYLNTVDLDINIIDCDRSYRFVCEQPRVAGESDGSSDYLCDFENSCYRFYNWSSRMSWHDAQTTCERNGAHLLRIQTKAELDYITDKVGSRRRRFWIDNITEYRWMDGIPALSRFTYSSDGSHGNYCLRLNHAQSFKLNDHNCYWWFGYICERKEVQSPGELKAFMSCPATIPDNLVRLGRSGALCLYDLDDAYSPPVLRECKSRQVIDECGCSKQTNGKTTVKCGCGFCELEISQFEEDSAETVWPSNFSCICSGDESPFNVTIVNGELTCVSHDQESTTAESALSTVTSQPDGLRPTNTRLTTNKPKTTTDSGGGRDPADQVGVPIGIPVAITLAVLFFLVALVVGFIWWTRRRQKSNKGPTKPLTSDTRVVESHTINVNPTYAVDDDDHVTEDIFKPITPTRQRRVSKPQADNIYTDIKPNDQAASESECYATIQSNGYTPDKSKDKRDLHKALHDTNYSNETKNTPTPATGYTAYKPQRGNDVYTDLKKTKNGADSDDDPAVYTLIPNNSSKPDKDDSENEHVQPENKAPPAGQRIGAGVSKATNPQLKLKNLTDSEYVDVDAPATAVGDSDQKGRSDYVDIDAPAVVFSDVSTPAIRSKQPMGSSGYVSVDYPSTNLPESQDHKYYQLENPSDNDEGEYSLAPTDNAHDTLNRAGAQRPSLNVPTDDGIYNPTDDAENNEYNTFNRAGNRRPSKNVESDDGVYSVTNPPDNNEYNTFNRAGDRRPSKNVPTDDSVYSVTNPPRDNEYSAFNRTNNRGLRHNIPINEGVYSLTDPPQGDVYSTVNRGGRKEVSGVPAITTEDEYSTLT